MNHYMRNYRESSVLRGIMGIIVKTSQDIAFFRVMLEANFCHLGANIITYHEGGENEMPFVHISLEPNNRNGNTCNSAFHFGEILVKERVLKLAEWNHQKYDLEKYIMHRFPAHPKIWKKLIKILKEREQDLDIGYHLIFC